MKMGGLISRRHRLASFSRGMAMVTAAARDAPVTLVTGQTRQERFLEGSKMNDILLWAGAAILIIGLPVILARRTSAK
jgi:hypothetical protein